MKESKEKQVSSGPKLRKGFTPLWSSRGLSLGIGIMFLAQITYYATEVVGLSPGVVGTLLMASKLFDAFSELAVGFLIDKTKTRLGKGRPYEVFLIPFWISVVCLFSVPNIGQTGKMIYIFILYTLAMSVFQTLLAAAETVYLGRVIEDQLLRAKVLSRMGVIIMTVSAAASMILPQLISAWGSQTGGWTKISIVYAIPLGIIGMLRFFFIREEFEEEEGIVDSKKLSLKESLITLFQNKYTLILAGLIMLSWLAQSMASTVGIYYFSNVIGDIGLLSIIGMTGLLGPFLLLLFPLAIRTIGSVKFLRIGLILAILGNVAKFFAPTNIPIVVLGTFLSNLGCTVVTMLNVYFLLQCIEFGQWKTGKRIEGIPTAFTNCAGQIGNGLASLAVGVVMGVMGYVANASTQTSAAQSSIVWLYSLIPAVICIAMLILLQFFDVEKKLGEIKQKQSEN